MSDLSIKIALDFVECTKEQKEKFLEHLKTINWKPINPNKLWVVENKNCENKKTKLREIEQQLISAKEISNLYELDYVIIVDEEIYFNQLT